MQKVRLIGCYGVFEDMVLEVEKEITIGRNAGLCQLVYPETARGISGTHGTFLADGTRLVPDRPLMLLDGQGFYLGSRENAFDVIVE